jgi:MFS family permease
MASPSPVAPLALDPEKGAQDTNDLPRWRKYIILFVVSWMTFVVTFSSTSLLPATPEIASEFSTTPELLNVTNAGVLLAMGFSSLIWGPATKILGRRLAYNIAIGVLVGCSVGTALSGGKGAFTVFRVLGGLTGTSFMVQGQTILADIFEPVGPLVFLLFGCGCADG